MPPEERPGEDQTKKVVIVVLTGVFIVLYVLAVVGFPWTPNESAVKLLQPIVYVIIGYFFGRMPSEANEKAQRAEASRQASKADAARDEARAAVEKKVELETRIRNTRAVLSSPSAGIGITRSEFASRLSQSEAVPLDALRHTVAAALQLLDGE